MIALLKKLFRKKPESQRELCDALTRWRQGDADAWREVCMYHDESLAALGDVSHAE